MVDISKEEFRRRFLRLAMELGVSETEVKEWDKETDDLRGFIPTAIDYLTRCDSENEANRTIDYLERKREISEDYAERLRRQLKEKGVRSFGPKKEPDYYMRKFHGTKKEKR